jgi:hypothetical protein
MSEGIPRAIRRVWFEEVGVEVTAGELDALNRALYEMQCAFRTGEPHAHIPEVLAQAHGRERIAMLTSIVGNFLREGD